jgi:rod shape-determining protein MreD
MSVLFGIFATYVVFVCETSLLPLLGWGAFAPRPVFAALVWSVWRSESRMGLLIAAICGLIADGLSTGPLGIDVVVYVVAAGIVQSIRARSANSTWVIGATTALIAFAIPVAGISLRRAIEQQSSEIERLCLAAAGSACSTAVLAAILFCTGRLVFGRPAIMDNGSIAHVANRWRMLTE